MDNRIFFSSVFGFGFGFVLVSVLGFLGSELIYTRFNALFDLYLL